MAKWGNPRSTRELRQVYTRKHSTRQVRDGNGRQCCATKASRFSSYIRDHIGRGSVREFQSLIALTQSSTALKRHYRQLGAIGNKAIWRSRDGDRVGQEGHDFVCP
jgi:hypothetical protein